MPFDIRPEYFRSVSEGEMCDDVATSDISKVRKEGSHEPERGNGKGERGWEEGMESKMENVADDAKVRKIKRDKMKKNREGKTATNHVR